MQPMGVHVLVQALAVAVIVTAIWIPPVLKMRRAGKAKRPQAG
jgi:hypothetical protein